MLSFHRFLQPLMAVFMVGLCGPTFCVAALAQTPLRAVIDAKVEAKWQAEKITPAPTASDAEFLRRVYLDLCGTIPTHAEAAAFLDDADPAKRAKLIDRLLDDPRFAQHQADVWDMVYFGRNPPGYKTNERAGFQRWLREQFERNTPYDKIALALLKAEGNSAEQGAAKFFTQYKGQPEDATEKITQTFLGMQLQCARCHDHPFETWTQLDFYGMAAFFARLRIVDVGKKANETAFAIGEMNRGEINFTGPAADDEPGQEGHAVQPKFLLGDELAQPELGDDVKDPRNFPGGKMPPPPKFSRKDAFAEWATAKDNPYFARATANRVWAQFLGRGLVDPVDNMSESNPPSHPELLDTMTTQLIGQQFDLKWLIREIVNSRTYQVASTGNVEQQHPQWFERARSRPLSAEELAAAWRVAANYAAVDAKTAERLKNGERYYPLTSGYHLSSFGKPTDGVGNFLGGLKEQLYLNNGGISKLFSRSQGSLLADVGADGLTPQARTERLYLSILSRRPTDAEQSRFVEFFNTPDARPDNLHREAMWVLMTSSEFRFNH